MGVIVAWFVHNLVCSRKSCRSLGVCGIRYTFLLSMREEACSTLSNDPTHIITFFGHCWKSNSAQLVAAFIFDLHPHTHNGVHFHWEKGWWWSAGLYQTFSLVKYRTTNYSGQKINFHKVLHNMPWNIVILNLGQWTYLRLGGFLDGEFHSQIFFLFYGKKPSSIIQYQNLPTQKGVNKSKSL
jgi:hypothetical protein